MTRNLKSSAPVVFFCYNRPEHTLKTLDALSKCKSITNTPLYIYIDAPRYEGDTIKNQKVILICQKFEWPGSEKIIVLRPNNFGLARNIIEGISEVLMSHQKVIVLEDDILVAPTFIKYMNTALNMHEHSPEVFHINGYSPINLDRTKDFHAYFSRMMFCWGWGTWRESWSKFNSDTEQLHSELINRTDRELFNFNDAIDFESQLRDNISGKIDTWAVKWTTSIFLEEGLCLTPSASLVSNIGMDGSGVHYNEQRRGSTKNTRPTGEFNNPLKQRPLFEDAKGRLAIRNYYLRQNKSSFVKSTLQSIKHLLKKLCS